MSPLSSADSSPPSAGLPAGPDAVGNLTLVQLVQADQERRWAAGERPVVEDYLERYPRLRDNAEAMAALLFHEFRLRQQAGEQPQLGEFMARFPDLAAALRALVDLNASLATAVPAPSPSEQPTVAPAELPPLTGAFEPGAPPTVGSQPTEAAGVALPQVAGYSILGILGSGGMGVVYKAQQMALRRVVALKMILHGDFVGEDQRKRFQGEAEAIAALQHPHIVQVHEVGEHNGVPYFSLEYCAGGSLADQLDGTPWEPKRAAALVQTLAGAVQTAHQQGLVHRDLKPGNVLLTADGTPKVTDFGLVKRLDTPGQTQSGAVVGTPSYMAPEQAGSTGRQVGPAADVYALGAVLYELLTGRPPFKAATPMDTVLQVLSEEPVAVRRLQPKVPRDLETICLKCLEKDPKKRYVSSAALAEDLRRFLAGEPVQARPAGRLERAVKWARRRPTAAALLGVTLLALVTLTVLSANLVVARSDAESRRTVAELEADKAKEARDFLVSIFELAETDVKGGNMTVREILADAELKIPVRFADQPALRGELVAAIEKVKRRIGRRTPQGMLLEARGTVQLQSATGVKRAAVPQALVYLDDRLTLSADAQVQLVILSDLHKERLEPGREVTMAFKGCEPADAVMQRDDSILMTFVRLPKGTFYMGWRSDIDHATGIITKGNKITKGKKTEIKEDFEIAVHDVTQGQWQAIMGDNPSYFSRFDAGFGRNEVKTISDEELKLFPVESVSWNDVQEFIKKLNEKERERGYLYRLPSEAEWEYACRGGATSEEECSHLFYFDKPTDDLSSEQANFHGKFPFNNGKPGEYLGLPSRVGAYPPNKLGLCDMHGNMEQWCSDAEAPGPFHRVYRGSNWNSYGYFCQAAFRSSGPLGVRSMCRGIRLARVPLPSPGR
jgi:formylglycine-generating enzyme required for sulfatase activity